jgi:hypothetical protein
MRLHEIHRSIFLQAGNNNPKMFCSKPVGMVVYAVASVIIPAIASGAELPPFPADPAQNLERTSFQTSQPWSPLGNLRSDVAMVYGIELSSALRAEPETARLQQGASSQIPMIPGDP